MITLPSKFERDIQSNQTFLIPLIVVDHESDDPIYISTNKGLFDNNLFFEDRSLKIGSIKESINLDTSVFKINNISFTLSNYVINGTRFSDFVAERGLLNKSVKVFYKTQSAINLTDCILIYEGNIKRFTHDDKLCKIQLEDKTEDKLSKEIPIANTGFKSNVYSKNYLDKPIPILYGKVDKAPAIPFLEELNQSNEIVIKIICDDTLGGVNKRMEVGSFFPDESTQNLLDSNFINPLYIYKDDYFQVLEYYDVNKIIGSQTEWRWMEYEQYTLVNGEFLQIVKKYSGLTASNPPADNELQCVKLRFPNNIFSLPNPSYEDDSALIDNGLFSVSYNQPFIKSPELSFDNPFLSNFKNYYWTPTLGDNFLDTFSQIPDRTLNIDSDTQFLVQDFQANSPQIGLLNYNNSFAGSVQLNRGQYELMSYLSRYAHINNTVENPTIQFIRIPNGHAIRDRVNFKLWMEIFSFYGNLIDEDNGTDILIDSWKEQFGQTSDGEIDPKTLPLLIEQPRINAVTNINSNLCNLWAEASGLDVDWYSSNYPNNNPDLLFEEDSDDIRSFGYLCNDGSAQSRTGKINYPNFWMRWNIIEEDINIIMPVVQNPFSYGITTNTFNPANFFNSNYCSTSLKNGNISDYNSPEVGRFFNLIDLENGDGGLFDKNELARYIPINQTAKYRGGVTSDSTGHGLSSFQKYTCAWNGVNRIFCDDGYTQSYGDSSKFYFGKYTPQDWAEQGEEGKHTRESEVLSESTGTINGQDKWFIWVSNTIENASPAHNTEGFTSVAEFNMVLEHLRVQGNTLISCSSWVMPNTVYGTAYETGWGFTSGSNLISNIDENIIINKTDFSSLRYGLVLPFKDQEISDDIHTDTYFSGKFSINFIPEEENGTTRTTENKIKVTLNGIDVNSESLSVDWETFDFDADAGGATLINQTLEDCNNNLKTIFDTFDTDIQSTNDVEGQNNFYDGTLPEIADNFHTVNNYNSLAMFFRLTEGANIASNIAKFNLEINNINMFHYIIFEAALDSPLYINANGRIDNSVDFRYTGLSNSDSIERPCDIIYHFIEQELNLLDSVDVESIVKAREDSKIDKFAFSLNKKTKGKKLIQEMCKNTNLFALFKGTSLFSLASVKNSYENSDMMINAKDVIDYSFTRTPIEKVNTIVNVKYKKDYATDEYLEQTGYCDGYDFFGNKDLGYEGGYSYEYLGLEREDRILEFESEFIRDEANAILLRDFIYLYNCNQHNIIKIKLPLKYINLEVGDIVQFDNLINNIKLYGEDYTQPNTRNGQLIYPYFIVNSIDKKQKEVNLEITQLHNLEKQFQAALGSITRSTDIENNFTVEDVNELEDFLLGSTKYFTSEQRKVSDFIGDGYIDDNDLVYMQNILQVIPDEAGAVFGDVNGNGSVNIVDVVALVNVITSSESITEEILSQYDVNQDGTINVIDIQQILNIINE